MKKLRRSAALLLTASMLALTACGGNSGKTSTTGNRRHRQRLGRRKAQAFRNGWI